MDKPAYPQPTLTETNRPLIEAWREGRLRIQHCQDCGNAFYFPRPFCPNCWSARVEWRDHSGKGRVVTFTIVHKHVHESFRAESPTVFAEIQLENGPAMLARCVGTDSILTGSSVRLVSPEDAQRYPLPTFTSA